MVNEVITYKTRFIENGKYRRRSHLRCLFDRHLKKFEFRNSLEVRTLIVMVEGMVMGPIGERGGGQLHQFC